MISTWTLRRHLKLNISLTNPLLPSPPYLSKQQVCPFFWYSQKLHQESSLTHLLTPASKPSVNPVGSTFGCTWGLTTVYHLFPLHPGLTTIVSHPDDGHSLLPGFPACKSLARHTGHFHRVVGVIPSKPTSEQATSLIQTLCWFPSVST